MGKTMKRINIAEGPKTVLGRPFRIVDIEAEPVGEVYQCDKCGNTIEVQKPQLIEGAGLVDLLRTLIFNIPRQSCTMQDSINAFDFMQQAAESTDGVLKVTDGIHDWLKKIAEKYGMAVYGVNANAILKALDDFERAHVAKGEKE